MTCRKNSLRSLSMLALLSTTAALSGCRGEDVTFDCEGQAMKFLRQAETEDRGLRDIPSEGPYPVAMFISEDGLNRLVASIIEEDVPFAGEIPFGILPEGPGEAKFEATSPPAMTLRPVEKCDNCVVFTIDFGVQLDQEGSPLSSGVGFADIAIPLKLVVDENAATATVIADYSTAFIDDWYLSVFGFDSNTHTTLAGALRLLLQEEIQGQFGEVELLQLGSWSLGSGEVTLLAREMQLQYDLGRIALGMASNLITPPTVGVDLNAPMPEDLPMKVAFDTEIMLTMARRMIEEGEIPQRYDEDGEADEDGIYGITLNTIEGQVANDKDLRTEFRVWRTADGYCGFANVEMPLTLSLNEMMTGIQVAAGEATLLEGDNEGIGVAAEEEKRLVDENQDLVATFRQELSEQVGNTLNYEELGVEGSRILFTTRDIVVGIETIDTQIDFLVLAAEDDPPGE